MIQRPDQLYPLWAFQEITEKDIKTLTSTSIQKGVSKVNASLSPPSNNPHKDDTYEMFQMLIRQLVGKEETETSKRKVHNIQTESKHCLGLLFWESF